MTRRMKEPFHTLIWKASIGYNDSWSQVDPEVLEKFAELIVKECAKIVEDSTWNLPHGYKAVDQANLVKKHFGVEE